MRILAFLVALGAVPALAQTYPTKPIRLVVPFAPGGSSTLVARSVPAEMEKGPAIIKRLADEAAKAAKGAAVVDRFKADDAEPVGSGPKEYADFIAKEQARWKDVIQKAGVKAD